MENSGQLPVSQASGGRVLALSIANEGSYPWLSLWPIDENASDFFAITSQFKQCEYTGHLLQCDR